MTICAIKDQDTYRIVNIGPDGTGEAIMSMWDAAHRNNDKVCSAATLLALAARIDGGWEHAIELLRAKLAEQG